MSNMTIRAVARAHHQSFATNGRSRTVALIGLYGPSVAVGLVLFGVELFAPTVLDLSKSVGEFVVAGLSLLAGLLFALGITVLEKAIEMDHAAPAPSGDTSRDALRLQALSANSLYTAGLAGAGALAVVVSALVPALREPLTVGALMLVVAVVMSGVRIASRVFYETRSRTDRVRTGTSKPEKGEGRRDDD